MSGFDDIQIGWKGRDYAVPATHCMELLGRIEEILAPPGSGQNVIDLLSQPHKAHMTKMSRAYATALRFAGCQVTDQEVYLSLAKGVMQGGAAGYGAILTLAQGLMLMFFPEWVADEELANGDDGEPGNEDRAANGSGAASSDTSMNAPSAAVG